MTLTVVIGIAIQDLVTDTAKRREASQKMLDESIDLIFGMFGLAFVWDNKETGLQIQVREITIEERK